MKWWADRKERAREQDSSEQRDAEIQAADRRIALEHYTLMRLAAGVSTVDIRCHEHTWDFICREASQVDPEHFRPPSNDIVIHMDSMVTVPVSGPTLVVILETLHQLGQDRDDANAIRASIAWAAYTKLAVCLETSDLSIGGDASKPVPTLTIEARPRTPRPAGADSDEPVYGHGEHDRPLATWRDQVAEDIRKVLRSGACREFTDDHGGFAVEGASSEHGEPFLVAAADDDGDQKADVIRYSELLRAAGYRVEPGAEDPLTLQVWPKH
jgi:hypothetical protein